MSEFNEGVILTLENTISSLKKHENMPIKQHIKVLELILFIDKSGKMEREDFELMQSKHDDK